MLGSTNMGKKIGRGEYKDDSLFSFLSTEVFWQPRKDELRRKWIL